MSEKSILEQALLQVQNLEEAVKANAKGILASTMKQELKDLLKESMEEEEKDADEASEPKEKTEKDMSDDSDDNEDGLDNEMSDEDETSKNIDDLDSETDDMDSSDDMDHEDMGHEDMDSHEDSDDDVVDMTGADDEEVLKVFKAMGPNDGVVVKKDGQDIELSTGEDEFIIKLDDEMEHSEMEENMEDMKGEGDQEEMYGMNEEADMEEMNMDAPDHETVYEIELDEEMDDMKEEEEEEKKKEEDMEESEKDEEMEPKEGDMEESARTKGFGYHGGLKSKNIFKAGNKRDEINEEVSKLKKQNSEYKKALNLFKDKLNEVAVFNANLAFATRLFTEHSTTKQEKLNILKRFDTISTLEESKSLYRVIKTELDTKKTVTESVVEKITSAPTSSSTKILSESKAYENPQFSRMKELMKKIK